MGAGRWGKDFVFAKQGAARELAEIQSILTWTIMIEGRFYFFVYLLRSSHKSNMVISPAFPDNEA